MNFDVLIDYLVAEQAHQRLDYHTHQRGQNPEVAKVVRVSAQSGEDATDVRALQRVGNLYAEESETDVPKIHKA